MNNIKVFVLAIILYQFVRESVSQLPDQSDPLIVGGTPSDKVPYQISLQIIRNGEFMHICGGAILEPDIILTAAHCVLDGEDLYVLAGVTKLSEAANGQRLKVINSFKHQDYIELKQNDIALLQLEGNGITIDNVNTATISIYQGPFLDNFEICLLTGWGTYFLVYDPLFMPDNLLKANQTIIPMNICQTVYDDATNSDICAKNLIIGGACSGDSGGPLVRQHEGEWKHVGIVSYGVMPCGVLGIVFTRTTAYVNWIADAKDIIREL